MPLAGVPELTNLIVMHSWTVERVIKVKIRRVSFAVVAERTAVLLMKNPSDICSEFLRSTLLRIFLLVYDRAHVCLVKSLCGCNVLF